MKKDAKVIYDCAREDLCRSIASLDESCNDDHHVQSVLEPIFTGVMNAANGLPTRKTSNESVVTPLMIACNRGNVACLHFFRSLYDNQERDEGGKKAIDHLLGDCLHPCQADGNNQAIHYAISTPEALDLLASIFISQRRKKGTKQANDSISLGEACLILLSQNNDHGDTPFMMAAAIGMKLTIETWIRTAISYTGKELLHGTTTNGKYTALSLTRREHHEVVEYLTCIDHSSTGSSVQGPYDDIQRASKE